MLGVNLSDDDELSKNAFLYDILGGGRDDHFRKGRNALYSRHF